MLFGIFVLIVALGLSAVAAYYSIVGLVAIFAAAAIPIIVMGSILEVAKITVTIWLHQYWDRCQWMMKTYLTIAVVMLMFITSMGVFGFLSRAHIEQTLSVGSNGVLIADIDRQIAVHERVISDANTVIAQLDQAVQSLIDAQRIRGAGGSLAVREAQKTERDTLAASIAEANAAISVLAEQKLPLLQSQQQLEAEVGPLKYIAALIYGDSPSHDLLENAVRWVIILIVAVFDPLAVMMVLAATESFKWAAARKQEASASGELAAIAGPTAVMADPSSTMSTGEIENSQPHLPPGPEPTSDSGPGAHIVDEPAHPLTIPEEVATQAKPSYTANYTPVEVTFEDIQQLAGPVKDLVSVDLPSEPKLSLVQEMAHAQREESAAIVNPTNLSTTDCQFGVKFPLVANKGDLFLRVDFLPTKLFKFNGSKWIEVNKQNTDQYAYNDAYIEMLISKISKGEYEPDWLSDIERQQIETVLQQDPNTKGNV